MQQYSGGILFMSKNNPSETRQILANTLLNLLESKPFSKITVNELCEKSMIVRSTFYLHFQDKYELLSYCLDEISKELETLMKDHAQRNFLWSCWAYARKKKRRFTISFREN